jgi:hypothetical protein
VKLAEVIFSFVAQLPHPGGLAPAAVVIGDRPVIRSDWRAKRVHLAKPLNPQTVQLDVYEAANVLLSRITRFSKLKRWGMDVAKRRGSKRAKVALARKIGVILHRMWIDGTTYRWAEAKPIAAQG